MTFHDDLAAQLMEVGLTRNEALAYLTLLADEGAQGLTGYEVAARSGIPRSVVYTTLGRLEANGAAFSWGDKPARYVPTEPTEFVSAKRLSSNTLLDTLGTALGQLPKRSRPEPVWILSTYDEVLNRIDQMIRGAETSIYLSLWPREVARLGPAFDAVVARDLHKVLHAPAYLSQPPLGFSCWSEDRPDDRKEGWSHRAIVVVDQRHALLGGTEPGEDNQAVSTANRSLVDVASNHLILDITLMSTRSGRPCDDDVIPMMRPHIPQPQSD